MFREFAVSADVFHTRLVTGVVTSASERLLGPGTMVLLADGVMLGGR